MTPNRDSALSQAKDARLYSGEWSSCDGLSYAEVRATKADGYWPGMVLLEIESVNDSVALTITVDDARDLAAHIDAAADSSDHAMKHARREGGAS